jgi:hypothetical protein
MAIFSHKSFSLTMGTMIRPRRAVLGPRPGPPQAGVALPQKQWPSAPALPTNPSPPASSAACIHPRHWHALRATAPGRTAPNKLFPRTIIVPRHPPRLCAAARPGRCLPLLDWSGAGIRHRHGVVVDSSLVGKRTTPTTSSRYRISCELLRCLSRQYVD